MAGSAKSVADVSGLDVVPGFKFTVMATEPTPFSFREIACRIIVQPVGDLCR